MYDYYDQPISIKRDVAVAASCENTMLSGFRNEVSHKFPLRFHVLINLALWQEVIDVEDLHNWREFVHPHNRTMFSDGSVHHYAMCVRLSKYVRALIFTV